MEDKELYDMRWLGDDLYWSLDITYTFDVVLSGLSPTAGRYFIE